MYVSYGQKWVYFDKPNGDALLSTLIFQSGDDFRWSKYQFHRDDEQYGEEMSHEATDDSMDEEEGGRIGTTRRQREQADACVEPKVGAS